MLGLGSAALATGVLGNVSGARGQAAGNAAGNAAGAVKKPANFGLVSVYEVDPAFPKKPDNITWSGGMPGVDVDAKDRVWIINRALPLVAEFEADGKFIQAWGKSGAAVASVAGGPVDLTFAMANPQIHQIKVDFEGNVWIATWRLGVVYKCSPEGKVLMVLGKYNERGVDDVHFGDPNDMAITKTGEIFVADGEVNFRIMHFDPKGKLIKSWGKQGKGPGEFDCPHALAFDSKGRLYVADRGNTRIQIFDQNGNFIDQWPDIIVPFDIWMDGEDNLWVGGYGPLRTKSTAHLPRTDDNILMKFDSQGRVLLNWTFTVGNKPGQFGENHGIALDSKGNIYVSEVGPNTRVQKFVRQA
jgi:DNA-binding beta-propeller fold protein YncE